MGSIVSSLVSPSGVSPETTSTLIINRTANPLALKLGPHHNLATVARNATYVLKADSNDTYKEYRLEAHANSGPGVVVSSDECVDNRTIVITEVEGKLQVEREPRAQLPRLESSSAGVGETGKKAKWFLWW